MGCLARAANATRDPRVLALMEEISSRVGNCIALHCSPWSGEPSNSNKWWHYPYILLCGDARPVRVLTSNIM